MQEVIFLAVVAIAGIYLIVVFWKIQKSKRKRLMESIEVLRQICRKLEEEIRFINEENRRKGQSLASVIALYDLTREINKSLKPQEMQDMFREMLKKYVDYKDCRFIKGSVSSEFVGYEAFEIDLGQDNKETLLVSGITAEDRDTCLILKNQLVLGLKKAYLYEEIQRLAITDALCGILSRRYVLERLEEELLRSKKFKLSFSLLMVDLDRFKYINDTYGHLVGDVVLRETARIIKDNLRQIDLIGRFGGEEFIIVLTEIPVEKAKIVSERIRTAVESAIFRAYDETLRVTISIGISSFPQDARTVQDLIDKADFALYTAKKKGRNMTCLFSLSS